MIAAEEKIYTLTELKDFVQKQIEIREDMPQEYGEGPSPDALSDDLLVLRKVLVELG